MKTQINKEVSLALTLTFSLAFLPPVSADVLYGVTHGTINASASAPYGTSGQLIAINTSTGVGTLMGQLDRVIIAGSVDTPLTALGIGARGEKLFVFDEFPPQLEQPALVMQVDPATGHTIGSSIDPGNMRQFMEGDFTFRSSDGLGFISALNFGNPPSQLVSIDITAPSHIIIGSLSKHMDGLAFDNNNVLYGINESDVNSGVVSLWTIDPATAVITLVGPLGVGANENFAGLAFDSSGTLFAAINSGNDTPSLLYKVNKSTGSATLIGSIGFNDISGLAFLAPPVLSIEYVSGNFVLSWSTSYPGYVLETSSSLDPTSWTVVPGTPAIVANRYVVTVGSTTGSQFFRLAPIVSGTALSFNGTSSYVSVGAAPLPPPWTAEFWVNRQSAPNYSASLLGDDSVALKLEQYNFTRQVGFTVFGDTDYTFDYTAPVSTWVHLAFVGFPAIPDKSIGGVALYVNGVHQETILTFSNIPLPLGRIGYDSSGTPDYICGTLDEVRVWKVARTEAQIQANMNHSLSLPQPDLVEYWKFDEGSGTSASDSSGQGNSGTLQNSPAWVNSTAPLVP
jgi:Concanavalin A-like lectin/glucanases superfamily